MCRLMFLLALIAALGGTPLRIAEAADDLARSLAELGASAGMEVTDGGVGDDSDASVKVDKTDLSVTLAFADNLSAFLVLPGFLPGRDLWRSANGRTKPTTSSSESRAWLQCFRC